MRLVFLFPVLLLASVALADYQYGESISCSNSSCEYINFIPNLNVGESKTVTIEGRPHIIKFVSYEKSAKSDDADLNNDGILGNDYRYTTKIDIDGKIFSNDNANEIKNALGFNLYTSVTPDNKLTASISEDDVCKGELKYNGCYTKYEIPISKGWNLIPYIFFYSSMIDEEVSTCPTDQSLTGKYIWLYRPLSKSYWSGYDARIAISNGYSNSTDATKHDFSHAVFGSSWYYSQNNCKYVIKDSTLSQESKSGYKSLFSNMIILLKQQNYYFPAGWNFFHIMPDMTGKKLSDVAGTCKITKAYKWNTIQQRWETILGAQFTASDVGKGFIFRTANDCFLGEAIPTPPAVPV